MATAEGDRSGLRALGYARQVTAPAVFTESEMRFLQICFRKQDWTAG